MVLTSEEFFEVVIECWPEWYLNPRPLNSVQTLQPIGLSGRDFLYIRFNMPFYALT